MFLTSSHNINVLPPRNKMSGINWDHVLRGNFIGRSRISTNIRLEDNIRMLPGEAIAQYGYGAHTKMVCLIQRHLDVAKRFNLTCCTVSRFSHWVVLVCEETWTVETLRRSISELSNQSVTRTEVLGFTLERSRPANINYSANVSTERLAQEYGDCIITCVGTTDKKEDEIFQIGLNILNAHADYQVLRNNCQDWAKSFVEAISPNAICPPTIGDYLCQSNVI